MFSHDCVEVDEYLTGTRREGLFYGQASLLQKVGAAVSIALVGVALSAIGFVEGGAHLSEYTLSGIKYLYGFGMLIPLILSMALNFCDPMNKKRHEALEKAVELKRAGETDIDESEIACLLK